MLESSYQQHLIRELKTLFPGCIVLKNDSTYLQGFPDLTIFFRDRWAVLEVKASEKVKVQPNQVYYVELLDAMSFAAFIYPENEEEVLYALQQTFESCRTTCLPER